MPARALVSFCECRPTHPAVSARAWIIPELHVAPRILPQPYLVLLLRFYHVVTLASLRFASLRFASLRFA